MIKEMARTKLLPWGNMSRPTRWTIIVQLFLEVVKSLSTDHTAELLTVIYWLWYKTLWLYINSENYLNVKYLWCYKSPPQRKQLLCFDHTPKWHHHWILIGCIKRSFSIFRNSMLITGIPAQNTPKRCHHWLNAACCISTFSREFKFFWAAQICFKPSQHV